MPGNDAALSIDQDRVVEPERPDGARDQGHLRVRKGVCVSGGGNESIDGALRDSQRAPRNNGGAAVMSSDWLPL